MGGTSSSGLMLGSSGPSAAPGLRAPSPVTPASSPPAGPYGTPEPRPVRWLPALGFGIVAAIVGGLVWGLILGVTKFMSAWVAIIIGIFIAWAVQKGAKRASGGLIVPVALLTYSSVFLGWIVAISMWIAPYGGSPLDAIVHFSDIVALAPWDFVLSFVFATVGVAAGAWSLWQKMRSERAYRALPPTLFTPPASAGPGSAAAAARPVLRATERSATRAALEVLLPPPEAHVVSASYNTWNGMAEVLVDGRPAAKGRVWGMSKTLEVSVGGGVGHGFRFVFRGAVRPTIDVSLDGTPLGIV